jgi:hypothetical protein
MRQGDLGPDEPAHMIRNLPNANWLKGKNLSTPPGLSRYARDTVAAEKEINEVPREEQGKAALTELFESLKTDGTPSS